VKLFGTEKSKTDTLKAGMRVNLLNKKPMLKRKGEKEKGEERGYQTKRRGVWGKRMLIDTVHMGHKITKMTREKKAMEGRYMRTKHQKKSEYNNGITIKTPYLAKGGGVGLVD